jgi:hypothetical protein
VAPSRVPEDDFDLDIRVVAPDGPQPVELDATERCTPRYGGYTCGACASTFTACHGITCCCPSPRGRLQR